MQDWRYANRGKGRPTYPAVIEWLWRYGEDVQDAARDFVVLHPKQFPAENEQLSANQVGMILGATVAQMFEASRDRIQRAKQIRAEKKWRYGKTVPGSAEEIRSLPPPKKRS